MKYFSMFSGIGGFELGIERAYETIKSGKQKPIGEGSIRDDLQRQGVLRNNDVRRGQSESQEGHRLLNGVCIGYSEIDKYACQIYDNLLKETQGEGNQDIQRLQPMSDGEPRTLRGSEPATCIGYSEIDKYACQIYDKHFNHKNYGDCTKLNASELPDFDLLVGGFPCQAFSIAGKRRGFDDTRGTLFFDIARILKEKRPRNFVLENVKGLLSHDNGRTFKTIISTLIELGYGVEWQVLNSKNFGVPQNRERVFIVGHLGGFGGRQIFPVRENSQPDIVLPTLTARYWGGAS